MVKSTANVAVLSPLLTTTALGTTAVPESTVPAGTAILFVATSHVFAMAGPTMQATANTVATNLRSVAGRWPRALPSLR